MSTPTPAARYPHPPRTWSRSWSRHCSRTWHRLPTALPLLPKLCLEYLPMLLLSAGPGLAKLRARLRMTHPGASLHTGVVDGRFVATVRLPLAEAD
jgi:hypothetical protein